MPFPTPFYRWRPHPWHGLEVGPEPPALVHAYVEITPFDLIKYEVDKATGYLRIDRPQRGSSQPPTLYGFAGDGGGIRARIDLPAAVLAGQGAGAA